MCTEFPVDPKFRLYRSVFEHARDATFVLTADGFPQLMNRAARALPAELAERLFARDGPHAEQLRRLRDEIDAGGRARAELVDGPRTFAVEGRLHGTSYVMTLRELTELRAVEDDLRALQRVASFGHFSASMTHDLNNLLTPIACLSATLETELATAPSMREVAHEIRLAAERATRLVRQILGTVRREGTGLATVPLNAVLSDLESLVARVAGGEVKVTLDLAPDAGAAKVDRERLEHAVLNLVANARDAMPSGGRVTLRTARVSFGTEEAQAIPGATSGTYAGLFVTDTGTGMTGEIRERIFERFFTTKGSGHGTGLGLDAVRRFVEASEGCISVHSQPGAGTTIALYFPRVLPSVPPGGDDRDTHLDRWGASPAARPWQSPLPDRRGGETLLVVDDDRGVRGSVRAVLENNGYRVIEAESGEEALAVARTSLDPIALVIADVVMPGMNGIELARRLRLLRPTRVLFTSGHSERRLESAGLRREDALLTKAFTPAELLRRVHEALTESSLAP
jgi:two-component system cell cycle sensor histidine kinase/response regulator CckA